VQRRVEAARIGGGHQMKRPAQQTHPDSAPRLDIISEIRGVEALDPIPERHIRIRRLLRLESDEVLEQACHGAFNAFQE
jgi:hypothetical protein